MNNDLASNRNTVGTIKNRPPNRMLLSVKNSITNILNQDTLFYSLFILFIWYAIIHGYLERRFFVNEIFSLFGFFVFLSNPVIYKKNDYIYNNVIIILFIFSMYAFISVFFFQNLYGYLRNLVIVYSVFSFFLGMKFFNALLRIKKKDFLFLSPPIATAFLSTMSFQSIAFINALHRTSYAITLPLYLTKYTKSFKWIFLIILILIMLGVRQLIGGSTPIFVVLLLILISILDKKKAVIMLMILLIISGYFLNYMKPYLYFLLRDGVTIYDIPALSFLFRVDGNTTTRFFVWSYLIHEVFINNIFGIGLGTELLPKDYIWNHLLLWIRDPYIEYTIGAHNSFLTILIRFGVLGLLPFIALYWKLITDFIDDKKNRKNNMLMYFYFTFFIITGVALPNVVMETPIQASVYWCTLGMLCQAKQYY